MRKKGFSMVEILVAVVILGIIGTIGVAGVTRIIKSSHERHNLAQAKLFVSGAQMYFTDKKDRLPTKTFTSKEVSLSTLQELNYVEKIVDYKKEAYDSEKSYAYVTKMGTGKYAYDGELITKDGQRTKYKPEKNDNGSVVFSIEGKDFTNKTAYTNARNKKDVKVKIKDPDTIAGYIITLYKGGKELRQLEYKEIGNQKEVETTIKISPEEYPDGQYQIQVKVIDIYNNQLISKSGTLVVDTIAPTCYPTNTSKKWSNEGRKIGYGCSDLGSGCKKSEVGSNTFQKTVKTATISYQIEDKAENITICNVVVDVYVDKTPPVCISSGGNSNWTKNSRTITGECSDFDSGCVKLKYEKIYKEEINTDKATAGKACDKAGNCINCTSDQIVKIDKTEPIFFDDAFGRTNDSNDVHNNNVRTIKCKDTMSGVDMDSSPLPTSSTNEIQKKALEKDILTFTTKYVSSGWKKTNYQCCDKAGNCTTNSDNAFNGGQGICCSCRAKNVKGRPQVFNADNRAMDKESNWNCNEEHSYTSKSGKWISYASGEMFTSCRFTECAGYTDLKYKYPVENP